MATKYGSSHIGRRAAENALHGIRFAAEVERPINLSVCINFETLGVGEEEAGRMFRAVRTNIVRWWKYQRVGKGRPVGEVFDYHAHANPRGSRHVHWQIHVPDFLEQEFREAVESRLRSQVQRSDLRDALHFKAIGNPGSHAKYVLRGIEPEYADYLFIRPSNEGTVTGRRTGVGRALSKAARKRAGWQRKGRSRVRRP